MMTNKTAFDADEAIAHWSREFISQVAPQELPLFRATSERYFNDPARFGKQTPAGDADKMIGFGSGEMVDLITPIVLVVVGEVVRFVVRELGATLKNRMSTRVPAPSQKEASRAAEWTRLRDLIVAYFSLSEMQDLCFKMGIDFEELAGAGKHDKARELIGYCARRGRMVGLIDACKRARPFLAWSQTAGIAFTAEQMAQVYDLALNRARTLNLPEQQAALLAGELTEALSQHAAFQA